MYVHIHRVVVISTVYDMVIIQRKISRYTWSAVTYYYWICGYLPDGNINMMISRSSGRSGIDVILLIYNSIMILYTSSHSFHQFRLERFIDE